MALYHFRAPGKFESLGIWQREGEENGREEERPLRKREGERVELEWYVAPANARAHKEINVSGSHTTTTTVAAARKI